MKRACVIVAPWALLMVVLFALFLADWRPFRTDKKVYTLFCSARWTGEKCSGKVETVEPETFRATAENQTVVYWREHSTPNRHEHCIVVDVENWVCRTPDANGDEAFRFEMVDGTYKVAGSSVIVGSFYGPNSYWTIVPKWRWWLAYLDEIGKLTPHA